MIAQQGLISIIVPVYNMERYLQECIDSLRRQTYRHLEILLIDDGSQDKSGRICDDYASSDKRIHVIHQENKGLSAVRNLGLKEAQGEYIAFVDADDYVETQYIEKLYQACLQWKVPLSCCNHWICESSVRRLRFPHAKKTMVFTAEEACANLLYHGIPDVSVWGKLGRRDVFTSIHYPDGHIYEDTYCIVDFLINAQKIAFVPEALYDYRIRDDSLSRDCFTEAKLDFLDSVDHMTQEIEKYFPAKMEAGIQRRKMHALLSVRRYFVDCSMQQTMLRDKLEQTIKINAAQVLQQRKLPLRDRIAIRSILLVEVTGFEPATFWSETKAIESTLTRPNKSNRNEKSRAFLRKMLFACSPVAKSVRKVLLARLRLSKNWKPGRQSGAECWEGNDRSFPSLRTPPADC